MSLIDFNVEAIPQDLRSLKRWIEWYPREKANGKGWDKVPVQTCDQPEQWMTFEDASATAQKNNRGLGLQIAKGYVGWDLDWKDDPEAKPFGYIPKYAREIIDRLATYTEWSVSGKGCHLWISYPPEQEPPRNIKHPGVEIYTHKRFFTMTGRHVEIAPPTVLQLSVSEIEEEIQRLIPASAGNAGGKIPNGLRDDALHKFVSRLVGMGITDPKVLYEAQISYASNSFEDPEIDLEKARDKAERLASTYKPNPVVISDARRVLVENSHGVERKAPRYLWPDRWQTGTINHCGGQQGEAKTPYHVDIYARITAGREWPDGSPNTWGPRPVMVLSDEDAWESVWLPRFDLAGGDDQLLYRVRGVEITSVSRSGEITVKHGLTALSHDLDLLIAEAKKIPNLAAIMIDPITAYLGKKVGMNNEQEVREVLTPLSMFAAENDLVINTIGHLNKGESQDPLMRMMGAAAFTGVARVVYSVGPDRNCTGKDAKYHHVMARVRGVVRDTSLRYHTELVKREIETGMESDVVRVVWDGDSDLTSEDTVTAFSRNDSRQEAEVAKMLGEFLKDGKKMVSECNRFLEENGFDMKKLNPGRIKKLAGVQHMREGRQYFWGLQTMQMEFREAVTQS